MSNTFSLKNYAGAGLGLGKHTVRITSVTGKYTGENEDKPRVTIGGTENGKTQFWGYTLSDEPVGKNGTPQIHFLFDDLIKLRVDRDFEFSKDPEEAATALKDVLIDKYVDIEIVQSGQYTNVRVKGLAKLNAEGLPSTNGRKQEASIL